MMNILLFAVIILAVITSARLLRVFDLTAKLRGREPYEITESENNINAVLMLLSMVGMFGMFIFLTSKYYTIENGYMLPPAASEHGVEVDSLLELNFIVISIAFFLTQTLMLWFCYRYRYNQKRKALHYAHNNKLELVWTVIPAIVLTVLILRGLIVWNHSTSRSDDPNRLVMEFYARQFDWTARFSGQDNILGEANFTMINDNNTLGLITQETIHEQIAILDSALIKEERRRDEAFLPQPEYDKVLTSIRRLKFQIQRVLEFESQIAEKKFTTANDDVVLQNEIHLPVNRIIDLNLRSQDVIHSAYLPHFRVHMYCVPGVNTNFTFKTIMTTAEMRRKLGNPDFNYLLYCNNICGNAHFNMMMTIVVDTEEDFQKWITGQKTFSQQMAERLSGVDESLVEPDSSEVTPADSNVNTLGAPTALK